MIGGILKKIWENSIIKINGKKILIIGTIETGKTTLHKFLREGLDVFEHRATLRKKKVKKNYLKLDGLTLPIKQGYDFPGQQDHIKEWKEYFKHCDICFYMFDTSKVYNDDIEHLKKIEDHLSHINQWKKEFKKNPKIILVGSFADKIPEYEKLNSSNIQQFEENIRKKIKKATIQIEINPSNIFIGSLLKREKKIELLKEILKIILIK